MAFKSREFKNAKFARRTDSVPVPGMIEWFDVSDEQQDKLAGLTGAAREQYITDEIGAVWYVHGLEDDEIEKCRNNAGGKRKTIYQAMAAVSGDNIDEMLKEMGLNGNVEHAVALRMEIVHMGSAEPNKIDMATAVKLSKAFPVEFRQIEAKIMELTGLGQVDEKKLKPSGKTGKSKAA